MLLNNLSFNQRGAADSFRFIYFYIYTRTTVSLLGQTALNASSIVFNEILITLVTLLDYRVHFDNPNLNESAESTEAGTANYFI